jgi:hypothetical protein
MSGGKYILDASGVPLRCDDLTVWARFMGMERRRVAIDRVNGAEVSTVFLGIDHSFGSGGPLLFETMIFGGEHDQWCDRYSTRQEAFAGHAAAVAMVRGEDAQ